MPAQADARASSSESEEWSTMQAMKDAKSLNPNLPMTQLSPDQIHDRLTARWSTQIVTVTLMAGIHISLLFGSEFVNLNFDQFGSESATRWAKTAYLLQPLY